MSLLRPVWRVILCQKKEEKMKIVLTLSLILLTANSYSQQIACKDLIGNWKLINDTSAQIYFTFSDSLNFIMDVDTMSEKCSYQLDNSKEITIFKMYTRPVSGQPWLIKINGDTLKIQAI